MRTILAILAALPLASLAGCGANDHAPAGELSIYSKDVPNGAAPKLGKVKRAPTIRLSNEGSPPK